MANKAYCPGCNATLSSIWQAFQEGAPCPNCGLSPEVARTVEEARDRASTAALAERLLDAEMRAERSAREALALRRIVGAVRGAMAACTCGAALEPFEDRHRPHEQGCPRATREAP